MMREKYESLSLSVLKDLAKARGIKGTSAMKKADVVEAMLAEDEKDATGRQTADISAKAAAQQEQSSQSQEKKDGSEQDRRDAEGSELSKDKESLDSGIQAQAGIDW